MTNLTESEALEKDNLSRALASRLEKALAELRIAADIIRAENEAGDKSCLRWVGVDAEYLSGAMHLIRSTKNVLRIT